MLSKHVQTPKTPSQTSKNSDSVHTIWVLTPILRREGSFILLISSYVVISLDAKMLARGEVPLARECRKVRTERAGADLCRRVGFGH